MNSHSLALSYVCLCRWMINGKLLYICTYVLLFRILLVIYIVLILMTRYYYCYERYSFIDAFYLNRGVSHQCTFTPPPSHTAIHSVADRMYKGLVMINGTDMCGCVDVEIYRQIDDGWVDWFIQCIRRVNSKVRWTIDYNCSYEHHMIHIAYNTIYQIMQMVQMLTLMVTSMALLLDT
jgi:hypothetical protein